jgi:putative SOS response-associated peptidase YedK
MPERYACAPRYNIARGQLAPAIVGGVERTLRWGLLAPWRGHGGKRGPMVYEATEDAIAATPHLRNAKPCLIPADGFYAWRRLGSKRVPYYIHGASRTHFAGLVATHADDGIESFAIVIVPASPLVAPIVSTMPRIEDALDGWRADAVSARVNDLAHDDAQCIAPLGNPAQGELF